MNEPLTTPACDLRDFPFMPLDTQRLLKSETWMEAADDPKLGHALICLWCEAWHQVPAGSLPDKHGIIARFAMCTPDEWERIRDRALHGWVRCSDTRLYHPVVAEKALEAMLEKLSHRRSECSREREGVANTAADLADIDEVISLVRPAACSSQPAIPSPYEAQLRGTPGGNCRRSATGTPQGIAKDRGPGTGKE